MDEQHHIRILLNGARIPQIGQLRPFSRSGFQPTVQLTLQQHRHLQVFCQALGIALKKQEFKLVLLPYVELKNKIWLNKKIIREKRHLHTTFSATVRDHSESSYKSVAFVFGFIRLINCGFSETTITRNAIKAGSNPMDTSFNHPFGNKGF